MMLKKKIYRNTLPNLVALLQSMWSLKKKQTRKEVLLSSNSTITTQLTKLSVS